MSREIKFRAWHRVSKEMLYDPDICNYSVTPVNVDLFLEMCDVLYHDFNYELDEKTAKRLLETFPYYLGVSLNKGIKERAGLHLDFMQYTGLKDKNGKEIYEGDFVKTKYQGADLNMEVRFKPGYFYLHSKVTESGIMYAAAPYGEVIGNIYENPELLEAQ